MTKQLTQGQKGWRENIENKNPFFKVTYICSGIWSGRINGDDGAIAIGEAMDEYAHEVKLDAISQTRLSALSDTFAFLKDHYWDTLEKDRDLIELHLDSCRQKIEELKIDEIK